MEIYFYLTGIAFLAGFIQGLSGFGSVLLSLPLMVLFLDIREAIPLVNLMGVILSVMLIVQLRTHWDWGKILPLLAGALPGIPIGVYLLKRMDPAHVQIILGLVLVAYAVYGFPSARSAVSGPTFSASLQADWEARSVPRAPR
jgi:uncharacterized membrane protein YfcA